MNVPRIKGNHNAYAVGQSRGRPRPRPRRLPAGRAGDELTVYDDYLHKDGPIAKDLKPVRNVKPLWSKYGLLGGLGLGGLDMWTNRPSGLFGLRHDQPTASRMPEATGKAKNFKPIDYPKPDGVLSFDRLNQCQLLDDQPRGKASPRT